MASPQPADASSSVSLPLRPKNPSQATAMPPSDDRANDGPPAAQADLSPNEAGGDAKPEGESQPRVKSAGVDDGKDDRRQQRSGTDHVAPSVQNVTVAGDEGSSEQAGMFAEEENKKKKKKKKSKKKGIKAGAAGPSGFEEYYVDPPVTPAEFTEEEDLYVKSRSFSERIQIAIQRYTSKRKFNEVRHAFWVRYLLFGGITSGPKQFQGGDVEKDEDLTAADIITLKATEHVSRAIIEDEEAAFNNEEHDPKFVVDFDGVMRAFLSLYIRSYFDVTTAEAVTVYCGLLRNWMNYLLHHNVCNEYADDIRAARKTIDLAERELTNMVTLPTLLPGTFSSACKTLYVDPAAFDGLKFSWQGSANEQTLTQEEAGRIFLAAIASKGDDVMVDLYQEQNECESTMIVQSIDTGLEVTGIFPSTKQVGDMYAHPSSHGLKPMGHITARTWWRPWSGQEDMTEEEEAGLPAKQAAETKEYTFWMDDETLSKLSVGFLMIADIRELSFGVWFIETVKLMYPSYSLWIPNELMEGWKEHVYLPPKKNDNRTGEQTIETPVDRVDDDHAEDGGEAFRVTEEEAVGQPREVAERPIESEAAGEIGS